MADLANYASHIGQILKTLVYIEDHLDEELTLEKLALKSRISPYYFHRLFRAYLGVTVADYIKQLRLQRAQEMLQYTDIPITDIAFNFGYESPAAFTKMFHQLIGKSPRKYRQIMQPLLQQIIKRTLPKTNTELKPEYVHRIEEAVLFVRRTGDYNETPKLAFDALLKLLEEKAISDHRLTYYSIALDNPHIVERSKCRFDAAVTLLPAFTPKGEMGQRTLPGGKFAVFTHKGPTSDLELVFSEIFRLWYPTSKDRLRDAPAFCEHTTMKNGIKTQETPTTKIYIPLL